MFEKEYVELAAAFLKKPDYTLLPKQEKLRLSIKELQVEVLVWAEQI